MSRTACIIPWSHIVIGPDGRATFCCDVPAPLSVGGRMGSLYRDPLDDLWNADEIVQVRAAMARGERPASCRPCWEREAAGGLSRRLLINAAYRQMGGRTAVEALPRDGAESGFRLSRRPDWFVLELGNVCNLRCRSCSPLFSSRIAADPVHAAWAAGAPPSAGGGAATQPTVAPRAGRLQLAPADTPAWFEDVDAMADMIASGADGNAMLSLLGGEPLLIDATWRLLRALVDRGVARHLFVGIATNGQQRPEELAALAAQFRGFNLSLSIDAHGRLYEYLRHGARWRTLAENLRWFRTVPNLDLSAVPTLQNANVLNLVTLLRFLDEHEIRLGYNVLTWPARLRPANLPPSLRRIAAARLRAYLDEECRPENLAVVGGYCELLEESGDGFDAALFGEFMTFTNDLDAARGESLASAEPELVALLRAAGVEWSGERRYLAAAAAPAAPAALATTATTASDIARSDGAAGTTVPEAAPPLSAANPANAADPASGAHSIEPARPAAPWPAGALERVNRTVAARDALFAGFEAGEPGGYFRSAATQLAEIHALLHEHGHPGLAGCAAVADFACHYGRLTRALRAALPHAAVYACDIDRDAVRFCAAELGALPVVLAGWRPDEEPLPDGLDAVLCVSLLTHTPLAHWRRALAAWRRMLRPGGIAAFTFLSADAVDVWVAGGMEHYGSYPRELREATARALREEGHGFAALTSGYGGEPSYGVAFGSAELVRRETAAAGFELLALPAAASPSFAQRLALLRKPRAPQEPPAAVPAARRDVSLVALYDPRCYAPAAAAEGDPAGSFWARLAATLPPPPLPTELGFGDPRVPEVREAQAALAAEHGVDAFCILYPWGAGGPRWDAPWRDLVASGRPDFPFCAMVELEHGQAGEPVPEAAAARLLDSLAPGLRDRRYLRLAGRGLLVVRHVARLARPRAVAAAWRAAAAAQGLGELHLCAAEPAPADRPEDLGFDSFLEAPPPAADPAAAAAAALARPWPRHRLFRTVECRRRAADIAGAPAADLYEHWLRSAIDATRRRGEAVVFLDAWNGWQRGAYLEPDDRDGRAALHATRRAARGPASGLVLLRQLRDALGPAADPAAGILGELGEVLTLHERSRDRLLASVEAALGRNPPPGPGADTLRWVPVASRQLPPSGGGFCLDRVGACGGADLHGGPVPLRGDEVSLAGWAHTGRCAPREVDLFLALESAGGSEDRILRVAERVVRPDVAAAFPGHPPDCGFDTVVDLSTLPAGTYRVAIVQRTPEAAYRDATAVLVRRL